MRAYLAIKFHEDAKNRALIERLSKIIENEGLSTTVVIRDYEKYGTVKLPPQKLMEITFKSLDNSDILIIELSEKGVGLGIEAGYAYAKGIPIIVIAKTGSDISNTLKGIAQQVIFYNNPEDLAGKLKKLY
jgi:nucleoside 2-deoxyribosyltransferase